MKFTVWLAITLRRASRHGTARQCKTKQSKAKQSKAKLA
jgi:hypothetical protein